VKSVDPGKAAQEGGLSGTVRANNANHLACGDDDLNRMQDLGAALEHRGKFCG
jgi:hypothetical protein